MLDEMNRRMQNLEEKFAYQERTIDALNDVIIDQQAQLDTLKEQLRELRELTTAVRQPPYPSSGGDDPPPPHY
ncbi:MAG: hypothetical protein A2X81_13445 [Desulfobacterales bacterium GWB2_56_26]|nr:MAG: hypothetical protein A2X81_13445 [Desulfobacterales bacterium GWB2_56_26]